jgi:hypothetical protein
LTLALTIAMLDSACEQARRVQNAMNFPAESEMADVLCTRLLIVRDRSRTYRSLKY